MAAKAAIQTPRVLRDAQLPHPEERPQGASRRTAAVLISMRRAANDFCCTSSSPQTWANWMVGPEEDELRRFREAVEGLRVLDQDAISHRLVRDPLRQQIEEKRIVWFLAGGLGRMRPMAAPHHPLGCR